VAAATAEQVLAAVRQVLLAAVATCKVQQLEVLQLLALPLLPALLLLA
jgi:hypothetical protein